MNAASFNDLVGANEQRGRYGEAKRIGGLEIDHHLKCCRLLNWQAGRAHALQDPVGEPGDAPVCIGQVRPVRHEATVLGLGLKGMDRRKVVGEGQLGNLLSVTEHRVVSKKDHALRSSLRNILEGLSQVISATKFPRDDLDSLRGSRSGDVLEERNILGKVAPENGDPPRSWKSFEEKLKALATKDGVAIGHPSEVCSGACETLDNTEPNWI